MPRPAARRREIADQTRKFIVGAALRPAAFPAEHGPRFRARPATGATPPG
ncbi:MAG: hypothetical protein MZV70_68330 [Desulfobacterales bacterium]|nr:hypothetical protein [Desulfobacterales bacterium]